MGYNYFTKSTRNWQYAQQVFPYTPFNSFFQDVPLHLTYVKFADETLIVGLITDNETKNYGWVDEFANYCHTGHLQLNNNKMIFDFTDGTHK